MIQVWMIEGMIGYGRTIQGWVEDIWNIELRD